MGRFGRESGPDRDAERLFRESQRNLDEARRGQPTDDELVGHLRIDATDPLRVQAVARLIMTSASHGPDDPEPPVSHGMVSRNKPKAPTLSGRAALEQPVAPKASTESLRPRKI